MRNGFLAAAAALLVTAACNAADARIQASGVNGQRSFQVGAFDQVDLAGPYDVIVSVGGAPSVRAEGDTGVMDQMEVRVEGGRLRVGQREGTSWSGGGGRVTVYVTAPALRGAAVSGSGDMRVGPVQAAQFAGSVAGSGNLRLERIQAEAAQFSVAGSGNLTAAGEARETSIDVAGSGDAELGDVQAEAARISIAGSGSASLRATGTASVNSAGSGDVTITGGARCTVSKVGSGGVRCG